MRNLNLTDISLFSQTATDDGNEAPSRLLAGGAVAMLQTHAHVWAIRPELLQTLAEVNGQFVDSDTVAAAFALRTARAPATPDNGVAVVPLKGVITPRESLLSMLMGGGGGLEVFRSDLGTAVADPGVKAVVLDVDSPGGQVDGLPEAAAAIRQARSVKPVVAVANTVAASAAYWLASQAHEVVASPSSELGSIGVYQMHKDVSAALDQAGIKPTLISAGRYKVEGNPYQPLDDEAAAARQQSVDDHYGLFTDAVAAGRGVSGDEVRGGFGQGRMLTAKRAVSAGLADRVATLDQTVSRLASGRAKVRQISVALVETETDIEDDGLEPLVAYTPEERSRLFEVFGAAAVTDLIHQRSTR